MTNTAFGWLCRMMAAVALLPGVILAQEPATITGRVTDQNGAAIPSATVAIPAMGLGATTRQNGEYTIILPGARLQSQTMTLTARVIGFDTTSGSF
jgi:hypothetical protein